MSKCPRTSKKQRPYSHPAVYNSGEWTHETKLSAPRSCWMSSLGESFPNCIRVPAIQPRPPCLPGELGRCLVLFRPNIGRNLVNWAAREKMSLTSIAFLSLWMVLLATAVMFISGGDDDLPCWRVLWHTKSYVCDFSYFREKQIPSNRIWVISYKAWSRSHPS